jgi:hypothetical protein
MKKRQQGDDENKKEEMVMTTLKRRATNDSIKHTRSNSEVYEDLQIKTKAKAILIHGDVGRRSQKTAKDGNTSIDLLFSKHKCL